MTLRDFRQLVHSEFGSDLSRMTPANVREFLDRVQGTVAPPDANGRYHLNEPERTYEGILRDFLRQSLEVPPEQAVIRLWLHCLELSVAGVAEVERDRLHRLFAQAGYGDSE